MNGGRNNDTFNLNGGMVTTADGGRNNDTFNIGAGATAGSLLGDNGNDTFNLNGGMVTMMEGGSGNDTFNLNSGMATTVDGGRNNDTFNVGAGSTVGSLLGDRGNDTFNLNGGMVTTVDGGRNNDTFNVGAGSTVGSLLGDRGNDTFNLNNGSVVPIISGGRDNDRFNLNSGSNVTTINGDQGNDTFTIAAGSTAGSLLGDSGRDTFNLNGGMVTLMQGDRGNDTFTVNSGQVTTINGGRNNDTFNLNGGMVTTADGGSNNDTFNIGAGATAGSLLGDSGRDTFNLNGGVVTTMAGDSGNDTFNVNSGQVTTVDGGSNNDTFNLNGGMIGSVDGGRNTDTLNIAGAIITGNVDGGRGNDTLNFTGGSVGGQALGDQGNDTFNIQSTFDIASLSSIDGGNGTDTVNINGQDFDFMTAFLDRVETVNLDQMTRFGVNGSQVINADLNVMTAMIDMQDGDTGDQLTVNGNMSGSVGPGAELHIDAMFTSTGGTADQLVVNGDFSDDLTVSVDSGTSTGGSLTPVTFMTVSGANTGNFLLAAPVSGGPYSYMIETNGNLVQLVADGLSDNSLVGSSIQNIISGDSTLILGTLEQRKTAYFGGGRRPVADLVNPYTGGSWGMWARMSGNQNKADGAVAGAGFADSLSYDSDLGFVQGGVAGQLMETAESRVILSVHGHYSDGDADLSDDAGAGVGTLATTSGGIGGSLTWLSVSGFYADLVGLASWHDIDTTATGGVTGSTTGETFGASAEIGFSFQVSENVNFVPQAQIAYLNTSINGFADSAGTDYDFSDADHLEGRFGVAVEHISAMYAMDGVLKANGIVSVLHDFENESGATLAGTTIGFGAEGTELELGGGIAVVPNSGGFNFGLQGDYRIPLDDYGREGFSLEATAAVEFGS